MPTKIAYIWIDTEYGFASRCEVYDGTGGFALGWKTEFSEEDIDTAAILPDLAKYKLTKWATLQAPPLQNPKLILIYRNGENMKATPTP